LTAGCRRDQLIWKTSGGGAIDLPGGKEEITHLSNCAPVSHLHGHNSRSTGAYAGGLRQSARVNGHIVDKPALLHSDVVNGGELVLEMGPEPNKGWGVAEDLLRRNR
jgi:hypothetical protein